MTPEQQKTITRLHRIIVFNLTLVFLMQLFCAALMIWRACHGRSG